MKTNTIVVLCLKVASAVVGLPINVCHLVRVLCAKCNLPPFQILYGNMLVANILILTVYNLSSICWLVNEELMRDEISCKTIYYLTTLTFHGLSNSFSAIAVQRMNSVFNVRRIGNVYRTKVIVFFAWVLATIESVPQAIVFKSANALQLTDCTTTFWKERYRECTRYYWSLVESGQNLTDDRYAELFRDCMRNIGTTEKIYDTVHLLTIFWAPFLLITLLNLAILFKLNVASNRNPVAAMRHKSRNTIISKRISALSVCYILCWLPYNVCAIVHIFRESLLSEYPTLMDILTDVMVVNSLISPFLYKSPK